jgi:hypothetical protein
MTFTKTELVAAYGLKPAQVVIPTGAWRIITSANEPCVLHIQARESRAAAAGSPLLYAHGAPMWFHEKNLDVRTTYTNHTTEPTIKESLGAA